ncbi:hypothetical protein GJAV_G00120610 [Gymnothorax javanicus]|nr:hypothetical protein GJAV_G00120610 [Gymnothorax javanicus]
MEDKKKCRGRSPKSGKKVSFSEEKALKANAALETAKRKEILKESLRKKFELEQKALRIVERLLEDDVADDFLIDCARFITPSNYKDTIEERSIVKMCGYPVCPNKLGSVPKQQFKISTKTNKVYDITERKCFCSNFCYKASKHFEVQISKTPLWLREGERQPDVQLLKRGESGSSGEEVKISDQPIRESEIENPERTPSLELSESEGESSDQEQDFVSSVVTGGETQPKSRPGVLKHRAERDGEREGVPVQINERDGETYRGTARQHTAETGRERDVDQPEHGSKPQHRAEADGDGNRTPSVTVKPEHTVEATADLLSACRVTEADTRGGCSADSTPHVGLNITQVGVSQRGAAKLRYLLSAHGKDPSSALRAGLLERLSRTLREWRTEETRRHLYGPAVRSWEEEEGDEEEEELDEDDLEIEEVSAPQVQPKGHREKQSAPVPDFATLQRETEQLSVQVQEFYRGSCVLPEEVNLECEDTSGKDPALPLVDSNAQHLIQKRIVSEKLNRSLQDIVGPLQLTMNDVSSHINDLIRTCRFTNANIIHKNPEWSVIAVVLLFVLSDIAPLVRESLEAPSAIQHISTLLRELHLTDQDLQSLVQLFRVLNS